jgi:hypothetical protein
MARRRPSSLSWSPCALVAASLCAIAAVPGAAAAAVVHATDQRAGGGELLCLDVAGGNSAAGSDVILHPCHGRFNQEWTFNRATGVVRSAVGNLCLDVDRGQASAGKRVHAWTCNGNGAQTFDYDPRTRRLHFRPSRGYCLDLPGTNQRARLWPCNDAASQKVRVSTPYGNRRLDELTFLTAHNAFANYEDSRWSLPNQSRGIGRALRDGVRGFMLDVHSFESGTARCIASFGSDCYGRDVYLCHGNCGTFPGITYALPRQTASGALRTIVAYLEANPDAIATVFLEDYVSTDELRGVLDGVAGLRALQFDPYAWRVRENRWPLARDLVDANRRLLLISDRADKRSLGVGFGPDLTVENYWSIGTLGDDYTCRSRWDDVALDRTDTGFQRLFVMNHFRDVATAIGSPTDNAYGNLMQRLVENCVPAARRKPNFIAVDFYETGDADGIVAEVDDSSAILFQHGDFQGRAQLLGPGRYNLADLGAVGNDAVSSLKVASGSAVVLYEHDNLTGGSRLYTASSGSVGDFNDRTSSVHVHTEGAELAQRQLIAGDFDGDGKDDRLLYYAATGDLWLGLGAGTRLDWRAAGSVAGFGNLLDGRHAFYPGDYTGDGKTDLLFYFAGNGDWWLGVSNGTGLAWRRASNTEGFGNLLGASHRIVTGDYTGDGKTDVLFHFAGNGDWWLGVSDGASLTWRRAGNTSGFGTILGDAHRHFTGDFTGDGKADVLFYYRGNGDWWLGVSDGTSLSWRHAGNTAGFGDLLDPSRGFHEGDFNGDGKADLLFHYAGNGDWWLGASDGSALRWSRIANSGGFGNIFGASHRIVTGDYTGDGKTDVMFHFAGNGDWWIGASTGSALVWNRLATWGSGVLEGSRLVLDGDFDGDGKTDVLSYGSSDGSWASGRSTGSALVWASAGNTAWLGDLTR